MEKNVIVVEDDNFTQKLICKLLEKAGLTSHCFGDGIGVVEQIGQIKPSIILLDLFLPSCTGMDVLKQIRQQYTFFEIPVIMISSNDDNASIVTAFNLGANDYIVKPLNFNVAVTRIQNLLKLSELYKSSQTGCISDFSDLEEPLKVLSAAIEQIPEKSPWRGIAQSAIAAIYSFIPN